MPSVQHVSSPSALTAATMSRTGARSRSFGPRHAAPMQKRVAPASFAARAASTTRVEIEQRLVPDAGVIARRLRAIAAVLGTPARLDRQQRRELHGVWRDDSRGAPAAHAARGPRTAAQTATRSHRQSAAAPLLRGRSGRRGNGALRHAHSCGRCRRNSGCGNMAVDRNADWRWRTLSHAVKLWRVEI